MSGVMLCILHQSWSVVLVQTVSDWLRAQQPSSHVNYKEEQQIRLRLNTRRLAQSKETGCSLGRGLIDRSDPSGQFVCFSAISALLHVDVCFYPDCCDGWCLPFSITISCQVCGRTHGKTVIRYLRLTIRKLSVSSDTVESLGCTAVQFMV